MNTIFVPSRDQDGSRSSAFIIARRTMFAPSAFMTKMSAAFPLLASLLRLLENAIFVPSGDQAGPPSGCVVDGELRLRCSRSRS